MISHQQDERYSRQTLVFGKGTQAMLTSLDVFIYGLSGLGVNVLTILDLMGPRSITIYDNNLQTLTDVALNSFTMEASVGQKTRSEATIEEVRKLNPNVKVDIWTKEITRESLEKYHVVIMTNNLDKNEVIRINRICRENTRPINFIYGTSIGFYGNIFVDFGNDFLVTQPEAIEREKGVIVNITNEEKAKMTFFMDKKLFEEGEFIEISGVKGMTAINKKRIRLLKINYSTKQDKLHEALLDISTLEEPTFEKTSYATFELAFEPVQMQFSSFEATTDPERSVYLESYIQDKFQTVGQTHLVFSEFLSNYEKYQNLPINCQNYKIDPHLLEDIVRYQHYSLPPMNCFIASLITNEMLKIGGKYKPINQWLHHTLRECIPSMYSTGEETASTTPTQEGMVKETRYMYLEDLLSGNSREKISNLKVLIVGVGAVGCEYLRQFVSMGFGTGSDGMIYITDFDSISMSNLSRQFFYRESDIRRNKAVVAAERVRAIDLNIKIEAFEVAISHESTPPFNDTFWENLDMIVIAVDNDESRKCLFQKACMYGKPIFDAGTNGMQCSHDPYIPYCSSKYKSTGNGKPQANPSCTLRKFPYTIGHILFHARVVFEETFKEEIEKVQDSLTQMLKVEATEELKSIDIPKTKEMQTWLQLLSWSSEEFCLTKAFELFDKTFVKEIYEVLTEYSSSKKESVEFRALPKVLEYNDQDTFHRDFLLSAANIYSHIFYEGFYKFNAFAQSVGDFIRKDTEQLVWDETLLKNLKEREYTIQPKLFDKDNDNLMDVDFVYSLSTLRAGVFNIEPTHKETVRAKLGNITPSSIISTSLIVSLSTFEIIKWVQEVPEDFYRTSRNHLAKSSIELYPIDESETSCWRYDEAAIEEPLQITIRDLVQLLEKDEKKVMSIDLLSGRTIYRLADVSDPLISMETKVVDTERGKDFNNQDKYIFLHVFYLEGETLNYKFHVRV